ncbi:MAG: hypothetical protein JNL39_09865 [Opitutaceae bacterium]|nr:hypothetical protein [Opitutaceae bacterium]
MNNLLHSLIIPGRPTIGPLPLSDLRERLRNERGSTDNATVVVHARMGDQFMPLHLYEELWIATLPPECAVTCPHCEALQPRCTPGERKCVRCGAKLAIDKNYKAELGADPSRPWMYVAIPATIGLVVFAVVFPNDVGMWLSCTLAFGAPWIAAIRQRVIYTNGYKSTAREDPVTYALAILILGFLTIAGLVMLVFAVSAM